jgi:hypothetical protein
MDTHVYRNDDRLEDRLGRRFSSPSNGRWLDDEVEIRPATVPADAARYLPCDR